MLRVSDSKQLAICGAGRVFCSGQVCIPALPTKGRSVFECVVVKPLIPIRQTVNNDNPCLSVVYIFISAYISPYNLSLEVITSQKRDYFYSFKQKKITEAEVKTHKNKKSYFLTLRLKANAIYVKQFYNYHCKHIQNLSVALLDKHNPLICTELNHTPWFSAKANIMFAALCNTCTLQGYHQDISLQWFHDGNTEL